MNPIDRLFDAITADDYIPNACEICDARSAVAVRPVAMLFADYPYKVARARMCEPCGDDLIRLNLFGRDALSSDSALLARTQAAYNRLI